MIIIKIKATGETREVTPNEAHGLIESGVAVMAKDPDNPRQKISSKKWYETREMRTSPVIPVDKSGKTRDIPSKKSAKTSKTYKSK